MGNLDSVVPILVNFVFDGKIKYMFGFKVNHLKLGISLIPGKSLSTKASKDAKLNLGKDIVNHLFKNGEIDHAIVKKKIRSGDVIFRLTYFISLFQEAVSIHNSNSIQSYGICVNMDLNNPLNTVFTEIPSKDIIRSGRSIFFTPKLSSFGSIE